MPTAPVIGRRKSRGLTLIEVLIVIVVIGILGTLAFIRFTGAQERAHVTAIQSDLRNFAVAQELHFENTGQYAVAVSQIPGYGLSDGVVALNIDPFPDASGYIALFGHERIWRRFYKSVSSGGPRAHDVAEWNN